MAVDFNIYLITDRKTVPEGSFFDRLEHALKAGVRAVQLREKDLSIKELTEYAFKVREITRRYNAYFFVNDRVDVAMAVGADGVHLGRRSMPVQAMREIARKGFMIGVSTHSLEEAADAGHEGADFITFGPVYETPSKLKYGRPLGIDMLRKAASSIKIPVYAIGGVNNGNISDVMETGVKGVAMISAIFGADNVEQKTGEIVRLIQ